MKLGPVQRPRPGGAGLAGTGDDTGRRGGGTSTEATQPATGEAPNRARFRLPKVRPRNLSDEVYGILRAAILTQEIPPGTRLLEAELGIQLGVSRAPIREAIRMLEHEGLIESFPRRGAIVVSLPDDEIETFYALRADIEAEAFRRACDRLTSADVETLERLTEELAAAYDRSDVEAVLDADTRFHSTVMDISGLSLLRRVWSSFDGPLRLRAYQLIERARHPESALVESEQYPHSFLLRMLRERDREGAAAAVRQHILEVSGLYQETLEIDPPS